MTKRQALGGGLASGGRARKEQCPNAISTPPPPQDQVRPANISSPDRADADDSERSVFELRIEGRPGAAGVRGLRWLLKALLRRHGFRCLDAREVRGRR